MPFNDTKAQFSAEELRAARTADEVFERVRDAVKDGIDLGDIMAIPEVLTRVLALLTFVAGAPDRAETARRVIALGIMLERDNWFLNYTNPKPPPAK